MGPLSPEIYLGLSVFKFRENSKPLSRSPYYYGPLAILRAHEGIIRWIHTRYIGVRGEGLVLAAIVLISRLGF